MQRVEAFSGEKKNEGSSLNLVAMEDGEMLHSVLLCPEESTLLAQRD